MAQVTKPNGTDTAEHPDQTGVLARVRSDEQRFAHKLIEMAERDVQDAIRSMNSGRRSIAMWSVNELERHAIVIEVPRDVAALMLDRSRELRRALQDVPRIRRAAA